MRTFTCLVLIVLTYQLPAQEIAITFDDAPTPDGPLFSGPERAGRILSHLKNNKVEAAFFVVTGSINAHNNERIGKYARAGHLIANHTHTHQWIHEIGTRAYANDVKTADSILRTYKGFVGWFRYPFLDEGRSIPVRDSLRMVLSELRLTNGYVTVDTYDWYINNLLKQAKLNNAKVDEDALRKIYIEHVFNSMLFYDRVARQHLGRSPKHVLLLHENDLAAMFLGDLLKHLKAQGWKIISPRVAYEDPIAKKIPDVLFNGQGRVAAIAREQGVPPRELVQESEDEAFLETLLQERKVFAQP
jgi:peptidoglycan/xylan/chitin deacetylase (PgdA/CDA1 family)